MKSDDDERTLSVDLNPDCEKQLDSTQCAEIYFLHIAAESANNTLHYIWDFTGLPSLFLAKTNKNTSLGIDWNSFLTGSPNSVNFSSTPDFIFSAVIHKVLLFEDGGDKANANDESVKEVTSFDPHLFAWTRENFTHMANEVTLTMNAVVNGTAGNFTSNGTIAMKVSCRDNREVSIFLVTIHLKSASSC